MENISFLTASYQAEAVTNCEQGDLQILKKELADYIRQHRVNHVHVTTKVKVKLANMPVIESFHEANSKIAGIGLPDF